MNRIENFEKVMKNDNVYEAHSKLYSIFGYGGANSLKDVLTIRKDGDCYIVNIDHVNEWGKGYPHARSDRRFKVYNRMVEDMDGREEMDPNNEWDASHPDLWKYTDINVILYALDESFRDFIEPILKHIFEN